MNEIRNEFIGLIKEIQTRQEEIAKYFPEQPDQYGRDYVYPEKRRNLEKINENLIKIVELLENK